MQTNLYFVRMGRSYTTIKFVSHLLKARKWSAFHSPYLFKMFTYCCDDDSGNPVYKSLEEKRLEWLHSDEFITRRDFGAGSVYHVGTEKTSIARIAKSSLSRPFQCRFMARLATFSNSKTILEFGTSLGITTAYLATSASSAEIITIEGDPAVMNKARELFQTLTLHNVKPYTMTFDEYLSTHQLSASKIDLLFLDGHHRREATIEYYQALKKFFHAGTIVIVDDIYWSVEMTDCWNELKTNPEIKQSVDCFHFGILFYNKDFLQPEHHQVQLPVTMLLR